MDLLKKWYSPEPDDDEEEDPAVSSGWSTPTSLGNLEEQVNLIGNVINALQSQLTGVMETGTSTGSSWFQTETQTSTTTLNNSPAPSHAEKEVPYARNRKELRTLRALRPVDIAALSNLVEVLTGKKKHSLPADKWNALFWENILKKDDLTKPKRRDKR